MAVSTLFQRLNRGFHKPLLFAMLSVDLLLIMISSIIGVLVLSNTISYWPDLLNIGRDQSIAEIFNFLKWGVLIFIFYRAFRYTRHRVFLCLSFVFLLILADDSLQLHEQVNEVLYPYLSAQSYHLSLLGDAIFWFFLGAVCLCVIFTGWLYTPKQIKEDLWPMAFIFAWVVFFGMGVDIIHGLAADKSLLGGALLIIEDGGEMVSISFMVAYVVGVFAEYQSAAADNAAQS